MKRNVLRLLAAALLAAVLLGGACPGLENRAVAKANKQSKSVVYPVTLTGSRSIKAPVGVRLKVRVQGAKAVYKSSAPKVASVKQKTGMVTVKKSGKATITALTANGKTMKLTIRAIDTNLPSAIAIKQGKGGSLRAGNTLTLKVKARYAYPKYVTEKPAITWKSSDASVATVDNGVVMALKVGKCVITAVSANGKKARYALQVTGRLSGIRIGIDPGHQTHADMSLEAIAPGSSKQKFKVSGGTSGYASGTMEYKLVLDVGLQLREALKAQGATVYMTRTTNNVNLSNQQRAMMMNKKKCHLVLRLHCDGEDTHTKHGIGLYVGKSAKSAAASYKAAEALMEAMLSATGAKRYGIFKSNNYTGLNWSAVPCILVEMGFMSNAKEDMLLNDPAYQQKLVDGMVNGICSYVGR